MEYSYCTKIISLVSLAIISNVYSMQQHPTPNTRWVITNKSFFEGRIGTYTDPNIALDIEHMASPKARNHFLEKFTQLPHTNKEELAHLIQNNQIIFNLLPESVKNELKVLTLSNKKTYLLHNSDLAEVAINTKYKRNTICKVLTGKLKGQKVKIKKSLNEIIKEPTDDPVSIEHLLKHFAHYSQEEKDLLKMRLTSANKDNCYKALFGLPVFQEIISTSYKVSYKEKNISTKKYYYMHETELMPCKKNKFINIFQ